MQESKRKTSFRDTSSLLTVDHVEERMGEYRQLIENVGTTLTQGNYPNFVSSLHTWIRRTNRGFIRSFLPHLTGKDKRFLSLSFAKVTQHLQGIPEKFDEATLVKWKKDALSLGEGLLEALLVPFQLQEFFMVEKTHQMNAQIAGTSVSYFYTTQRQIEEVSDKLRVAIERANKNLNRRLDTNLIQLRVDLLDTSSSMKGYYQNNSITITPKGLEGDIDQITWNLLHEMGHYVYERLSSGRKRFWYDIFNVRNKMKLSIKDILKTLLRERLTNKSEYAVFQVLREKYPVLALQLETLDYNKNPLSERSDPLTFSTLKALFDSGITELSVPKLPITGYAGTNEEEFFCEVFALVTSTGGGSLPDQVRYWWNKSMPKRMACNQRVADRWLK